MPKRYVVEGEVTWRKRTQIIVEANNEDEAVDQADFGGFLLEQATIDMEQAPDTEDLDITEVRPAPDDSDIPVWG